jgi:hypothetical protein
MGVTNMQAGTRVDEIAEGIYRISTPVTEVPGGFAVQPANELVDVALSGTDRADELRWLRGIGFGVGDADGVLVDIETDEKRGNLGHG